MIYDIFELWRCKSKGDDHQGFHKLIITTDLQEPHWISISDII